MIQFVCDSCRKVKKQGQAWILGLAADTVGATTARREVDILSSWTDERAVHPLGVHFCSAKCKDKYMKRLFDKDSAAA